MKITVLDRATLGDDLDISALERFGITQVYQNTSPDELAVRIVDSNAIFVNKTKLSADVLAKAKKLKIICEAATGFDNIDTEFCKKAGIAVCNVPGYSSNSVSQVTVAMVLYLACHLGEYTAHTRSGVYTKNGVQNHLKPVFNEICGKTWGIVGYGGIGSKVGDAARALGCKVIVCKRTPTDGVECVDIDTLVSRADIISVHTPLNDTTRNLINKERIGKMKSNVIFVNTARGAVTDEHALCDAIKQGKISGLGTDVYSTEPFGTNSPFYEIKDLPNVCFTPHMAWGAYEARVRCFDVMLKNLESFLNGEVLNRVDI